METIRKFDRKYNLKEETVNALEIVYEILIELWDIRLDLENRWSITEILYPPFNPFKTIGKYWNPILDMSSTVSNNSSPSFLIPSPQELSDITSDERTLRKIARKFRQRPADHSLLRYYHFLSVTVEELENSLERAQLEWEFIHEHLFESRRFTTQIRPLIEDFRQERAIQRRSSHPYDRPRSHDTHPLSTTSPPPITI